MERLPLALGSAVLTLLSAETVTAAIDKGKTETRLAAETAFDIAEGDRLDTEFHRLQQSLSTWRYPTLSDAVQYSDIMNAAHRAWKSGNNRLKKFVCDALRKKEEGLRLLPAGGFLLYWNVAGGRWSVQQKE